MRGVFDGVVSVPEATARWRVAATHRYDPEGLPVDDLDAGCCPLSGIFGHQGRFYQRTGKSSRDYVELLWDGATFKVGSTIGIPAHIQVKALWPTDYPGASLEIAMENAVVEFTQEQLEAQ